ncbi:centrosomal protein of 85 kDa isoform X3 [Ictalurus furcatus]|uniref:centrosomal protein of 85 kDa isoform X3 n=1 Tax=Ictalurus furcatus TaxID=66913 RepID=UPI0023503C5A|nr:centrosomal protein of 85 kDa isoform X3 [Ictalurus furcatus]XP_053467042.1 centrosomal protein of 85 kDa isoform X3 [Ictalurus furcatus]XP_053467043.1 centrosomal protein of 85 kDa isoform X3 [Ictalurus furcatus]
MTTSPRYPSSRPTVGKPDVEFQTPAVSEKFQGRFGWRPRAESETDAGAKTTDSTEAELCSPSFQPIRSQIPIPTAHVMPSTAHSPLQRPTDSRSSSSGSRSSLCKSASSPNLEAQDGGGVKQDCLSRYRSLVNGLDHSLFPGADHNHTRLDEGQGFDTPPVEPTLNQSGLLGGFGPDVRMKLHMTGLGDGAEYRADAFRNALDQTYKVLPEARTGIPSASESYGKAKAHPGENMADWQQKFESLRMQVEHMQENNQLWSGDSDSASSHQPVVDDFPLNAQHTQWSGQYSSPYPAPLLSESGKWEAVMKANESLLKEKELIIDRQKQQLYQLEQRLRESELQIHGALIGRGAPFTDVCLLRLQEAQRENAFLRAQFAERSDSFAQEKLEADRRLGAVEAETQRLSESLKESAEKHVEELKKQEERIRNRDKHITNLKKKCQKEAEQNREKQQRIETLERYLADLPTMEDYQSQRKRLEAAEQKVDELQGLVEELEAQLKEVRAANRAKDGQLEEQNHRERELLATVTSLQARVQEGLDDGARLPSLDVEKLREENASLKEEQQKLRKVIEKQLRMTEQLGSQIRSVQQQLAEEESSGQALRDELNSKDQQLLQLRSAVKELSAQNQELMEQSVCLRERLQAESSVCDVRLAQQLLDEMASCLSDLRSLCSVLTHTAHGRDPNLSLLLGITAPAVSEACDDWRNPAVLQKKLQEALQLRRDVEDLRNTVSDRYAQDMGENCTTQ